MTATADRTDTTLLLYPHLLHPTLLHPSSPSSSPLSIYTPSLCLLSSIHCSHPTSLSVSLLVAVLLYHPPPPSDDPLSSFTFTTRNPASTAGRIHTYPLQPFSLTSALARTAHDERCDQTRTIAAVLTDPSPPPSRPTNTPPHASGSSRPPACLPA